MPRDQVEVGEIAPTPAPSGFTPWEELTAPQRRRRSETAAWATFERYPCSRAGKVLVASMVVELLLPAKLHGRKTKLGEKSLRDLHDATGAILGDVLHAAAKGWAVKRSVRKGAFTGRRVSRTDWADVTGPMRVAGLLDYAMGNNKGEGSFSPARAPVICATPKLVAMASGAGIELATIGRHFQRTTVVNAPIGCRGAVELQNGASATLVAKDA
jgi:hypothetical protein